MYVLVHHNIHDRDRFWAAVQDTKIPDTMKLHQSIPAKDGSRATCLWEAESTDAVRDLVEGSVGEVSTNVYMEAVNKDGIAMPSLMKA